MSTVFRDPYTRQTGSHGLQYNRVGDHNPGYGKGGGTMKISLSKFMQTRTNIYLCNRLGWRYALSYTQFMGALYFHLFNRMERRKIRHAVESVFENQKDRRELRDIVRRIFRGITSHYYEKLFNVFASFETEDKFYRTHIRDYGIPAIQKGLAWGKGVLLITGHYGGVEFIPGFLSVHGIPVSIVAKFSTERLRKITLYKAGLFSTKIIEADSTRNVIKEIMTDLKNNRVVVTQCDEIDAWHPSVNQTIPFLGKRALLDRTMNILIKRSGAETVFGLVHRDRNHRYRFIAESAEDAIGHFQLSKNHTVGGAALKFLESYIYAYPEGWYQWKKYAAIPVLQEPQTVVERPLPVLEPSLG